jgi:hypothetical protein
MLTGPVTRRGYSQTEAVFLVIGFGPVGGNSPGSDDSASKISAFYHDLQAKEVVAAVIVTLAVNAALIDGAHNKLPGEAMIALNAVDNWDFFTFAFPLTIMLFGVAGSTLKGGVRQRRRRRRPIAQPGASLRAPG